MGGFFNATTAPTGGDARHVRKSRVPVGQCYVPHEGQAAKLRRLKQRTRHLRPTIEQGFRLNVWLKSEPMMQANVNHDRARMVVLNTALCHSERTIISFEDALDVVLDRLEREVTKHLAAAALTREARV